ncbi:hypothetical protein H4R20_003205, partial [Coemansia guatemalensis]
GGAIILCQVMEDSGDVPLPRNFALHQLIHLEQVPTAPADMYKVDFIYEHKTCHGEPTFKVHWCSYDVTEGSWVPFSDFSGPSLPEAYAQGIQSDANCKWLLNALKAASKCH